MLLFLLRQSLFILCSSSNCLFILLSVVLFATWFRIQHELEASTKQAIFVDSSINDTIRTCIVLRNNRAAAKVKSEFKVSLDYLFSSLLVR